MNESEKFGFYLGMASGFDLDSVETDDWLSRLGLSTENSLLEVQTAIRLHVDEQTWNSAMLRIKRDAGE